jgi:hypothetical protein
MTARYELRYLAVIWLLMLPHYISIVRDGNKNEMIYQIQKEKTILFL